MPVTWPEAEGDFFRALNAFVEPWVRAGVGGPGIAPTGLVVLETTGRTTGLQRRTPLLATVVEGCLVAGTVRGARSQWIKNAAANSRLAYWRNSVRHEGEAVILAPAVKNPLPEALPPLLRHLAEGPLASAVTLGWAFVIVLPADP